MFSYLYNKYINELFAYGSAFGVEQEELQDIIHDVFLYVMDHTKDLKNIQNIKFYLFRCLKNRIFFVQKQQSPLVIMENLPEQFFSIELSGLEKIEETEERQKLLNYIEQLLNCLTNRQKEAIYLRFMQEMSYEEIAELLNITPKGARKLIYRAIERVKEENISFLYALLLLKYVIV